MDTQKLVNRAHIDRNLGRRGTWVGHQDQFNQKKNRLKKLITEADSKGCRVSPDDRRLADATFPAKPAKR